MDYLIICLIVIIIIAAVFLDDGETFMSYMRPIHALPYKSKYYRQDYVPPVVLPPGYNDINYLYKNNKKGIPIISSNKYCSENPHCYPCPNWKYIGHPMCTGYSGSINK